MKWTTKPSYANEARVRTAPDYRCSTQTKKRGAHQCSIVTIGKNLEQLPKPRNVEASNSMPKSFTSQPKDTHKLAYILHFFLGAGNWLPWNTLITAVDYFGNLYPGKQVEKVFSVVYMASSLLVLVLLLSWGCFRRNLSLRWRMNIGFSMFFCSLKVTPMMQWIWYKNGSLMSSRRAYNVVIGSVFICGVADGLIGGSLINSRKANKTIHAGHFRRDCLVRYAEIKFCNPLTFDQMCDLSRLLEIFILSVNGYLTSVLMILNPKAVPASGQKSPPLLWWCWE